jgi:hypothetical protein
MLTRFALNNVLPAFRFFQEHAAGIVGETAKTALALARAEYSARWVYRLEFVWRHDDDADWSWMDQDCFKGEREKDHEVEWCACYRVTTCGECGHEERALLVSLGGIFDADATYRRVVEAELALEALERVR